MNLGNSAQSYIGLRGHTDFLEQFCIAKQNNQLHHAYLFFGKLGIGKSLLARQLAAYLLQEEKENTPVFNGMEQNEVKNILSLNENNSVWRQVKIEQKKTKEQIKKIKKRKKRRIKKG